ncbi:fasciclin domain-containing protein [Jannaschia seohaensis]|uniref:Putative surface protein with fasciclin (FAS1) repeats n=1 Tax=Jannaschia seohaensis TaxID=475081 RepID=A0A2Y9AAC7_9RHOB|nr:fasciclin domain-containing protein [Jannaschia seohaensis]PWJ21114.1 putative surface protein with fasciclin (FAS1) repeats [Jannaschia seohaensis]SSA41524.1 Uncaracterized surface protein containing fasciclin (FAS1) repeats [Jannaschia seohaensis]
MTLKALGAELCLATPTSAASLAELVRADARLSLLAAALDAAGLTGTIAQEGRFTVYAPTDDAFAALRPGLFEALLAAENRAQLTELLRYHLDDRVLTTRDLPNRVIRVQTLLDKSRICLERRGDGMVVIDANGGMAQVTEADIRADNGVLHVIDRVLVPGGIPVCEDLAD